MSHAALAVIGKKWLLSLFDPFTFNKTGRAGARYTAKVILHKSRSEVCISFSATLNIHIWADIELQFQEVESL